LGTGNFHELISEAEQFRFSKRSDLNGRFIESRSYGVATFPFPALCISWLCILYLYWLLGLLL